jgi:hypothetical protein
MFRGLVLGSPAILFLRELCRRNNPLVVDFREVRIHESRERSDRIKVGTRPPGGCVGDSRQ